MSNSFRLVILYHLEAFLKYIFVFFDFGYDLSFENVPAISHCTAEFPECQVQKKRLGVLLSLARIGTAVVSCSIVAILVKNLKTLCEIFTHTVRKKVSLWKRFIKVFVVTPDFK